MGEARDRRAFARVQRDCVGYMELRLKLKYTWQLFPCLPVQIINGRLPTGSTVLQSKRANFVVFKIFCYFQESVQEGSTLSLWEDTTSTCTALLEVTCCHVI